MKKQSSLYENGLKQRTASTSNALAEITNDSSVFNLIRRAQDHVAENIANTTSVITQRQSANVLAGWVAFTPFDGDTSWHSSSFNQESIVKCLGLRARSLQGRVDKQGLMQQSTLESDIKKIISHRPRTKRTYVDYSSDDIDELSSELSDHDVYMVDQASKSGNDDEPIVILSDEEEIADV
ncbi:hypothetical protein K492DRAFT_200327 [Lichtheimia hyalospora FSU 10163]|nr:hypothetical protein K492DRAFT_200327 [Lichtheimia hyalospora FSU 10163]